MQRPTDPGGSHWRSIVATAPGSDVGPCGAIGHHARVAELADAPDLGSGGREAVGVRVSPLAPVLTSGNAMWIGSAAGHGIDPAPIAHTRMAPDTQSDDIHPAFSFGSSVVCSNSRPQVGTCRQPGAKRWDLWLGGSCMRPLMPTAWHGHVRPHLARYRAPLDRMAVSPAPGAHPARRRSKSSLPCRRRSGRSRRR